MFATSFKYFIAMKYSFKILCLLSAIAFTGVMLSRSDGGGQYSDNSSQKSSYITDHSGNTGAVSELQIFAVLPAIFNQIPMQSAETSNDGLIAYSWEKDQREYIKRSCRNISLI